MSYAPWLKAAACAALMPLAACNTTQNTTYIQQPIVVVAQQRAAPAPRRERFSPDPVTPSERGAYVSAKECSDKHLIELAATTGETATGVARLAFAECHAYWAVAAQIWADSGRYDIPSHRIYLALRANYETRMAPAVARGRARAAVRRAVDWAEDED
ncbi:MAG TPA: hypothetical protein VIL09_10480 [Microvirga sp.]|jgi:hypothetical protein